MYRVFLLISFSLLLFTSAAHAAINGIDVKKRNKLNRLFVISVGVSSTTGKNSFAFNKDSTYSHDWSCPTCLTDASGLSVYLQKLKTRLPGMIDTVVSWQYSNKSINTDTLHQAFLNVQKQAGPDDVFVFYYASILWGNHLNPDNQSYEGYYNLADAGSGYDKRFSFTLNDLKTFTDRVAAKRQLIIFDTGFGELIQSDYYKNFYSDNPLQALFTQKERVFICPENFSGESEDTDGLKKGDLFRVISNMPVALSVFTLFDDKKTTSEKKTSYKQFMQRWYQEQQQCMVQIKILREKEYLQILTAIKPMGAAGKRGNILLGKQAPENKKLTTRTKKALVISTNKYMSPVQWPTLKNAANDGLAVAEILSLQGYEVVTLFDKPQDSVLEAVSLFCNESDNPYNQNVIYIAGHGYYDSRQQAGYVVCSDSREFKDPARPTASELKTYLDYTVLFRNMEQLNKVIFITDVCFGGTAMNSMLQNKTVVNPDKDASSEKNPYKRVLSSGVKQVDDFVRLQNGKASDHSPFAHALIDVFKKNKNELSFESLFDGISKARWIQSR